MTRTSLRPWRAFSAVAAALLLLVGCGGTTEETDTAVGVGQGAGADVPTEPVTGTGGSVVEAPATPGGQPTIGVGTEAAPGATPPIEGDSSP